MAQVKQTYLLTVLINSRITWLLTPGLLPSAHLGYITLLKVTYGIALLLYFVPKNLFKDQFLKLKSFSKRFPPAYHKKLLDLFAEKFFPTNTV